MPTHQDLDFMAQAIRLAKRGQYTTTPNPRVGCVIVKNGVVIGSGWHKKAGTGHAEVNALASLSKEDSRNATAYVTLEPCSHYGRTPPCAQKLIDSNITRVVVGMLDTNPQVAGNGMSMLRDAGIEVEVGVLEADCRALNPGFFSHMERQRPFVQVKLAASLDGKTALSNGESKWITGPAARSDVQTYRAKACAICTSATTVIADNASMNVRARDLNFEYPIDTTNTTIRQPAVVVLDGQSKISPDVAKTLALFSSRSQSIDSQEQTTAAKIILVQGEESSYSNDDYHDLATPNVSTSAEISVEKLVYDPNIGFNLEDVLGLCSRYQLNLVWVEAGGRLAASFIENNLADELITYIAPKVLGRNGQEVLPIGPYSSMSEVLNLNLVDTTMVGEDIRLTYTLD